MGGQNFRVAVRMRPLIEREIRTGAPTVMHLVPINSMPHPPQLGDRVGLTRDGPGVGHLTLSTCKSKVWISKQKEGTE